MAAIVTIVVVAIAGSKVAFADSGESYDLGHGVHITIEAPNGWEVDSGTDGSTRHLILQREGNPVSSDEAFQGVSEIADGNAADVAVDAVVITADQCSDHEPDALESQAFARQGAWMVTPAVPGRTDDYRTLLRLAVRTAESCSGYTPGVVAASGTKTGTPSTAATDLVSKIADGQIITGLEIK